MGFGFTFAVTFRSFHILFRISETFPGTFVGLYYHTLLSQNIYQPTTLCCKINRMLIEPFLQKFGFKCIRKLSHSFQLQKICCHFTQNKTFHVDGHLLAPGKAKSVQPAPKCNIRKELTPLITSEEDVEYAWWQLNSSGKAGFVTLYNTSSHCSGAFPELWDKSEGTQQPAVHGLPPPDIRAANALCQPWRMLKCFFFLSPLCRHGSCPSGRSVLSTVFNSSFRCYSCLPRFEFKVSTILGKNQNTKMLYQ